MGTNRRDIDIARRRAEALRLRHQGYSYRDIAKLLGVSESIAANDVKVSIEKLTKEPGEQVRQMELERLDLMYMKLYEMLLREHVVISNGRIVRDKEGEPVRDDGPTVDAITAMLKVQERRSRYMGLDYKDRTEGEDGNSVRSLLGTLLGNLKEKHTPQDVEYDDEDE